MPLSPIQKARARELDKECWDSYSGKPVAFKQYMEGRRNLSLEQARKEEDKPYHEPKPEDRIQVRYSCDEIARMRKAISRSPSLAMRRAFYQDRKPGESDHTVEDKLRTYMLNGTTPAELEEAADAEWEAIKLRRAEREAEKAHEIKVEITGSTKFTVDLPERTAARIASSVSGIMESERIVLRTKIEGAIRGVIDRVMGR